MGAWWPSDTHRSECYRSAALILGRAVCGQWESAVEREWLSTNGIGGYASGTIAGANTRRYHAFLMASFDPPVERTLLVAKVDLSVEYLGTRYHLSANEFADGTVDPRGFIDIESFEIVDGIPTWRYALADALLEQRIFMQPLANTSYLTLEARRASAPMHIELRPLVAYRDYHSQNRGALPFRMQADTNRCTVFAFDGARPFHLELATGRFAAAASMYWNFLHREEATRGLDALEDLWSPGTFAAELPPGESRCFSASSETQPSAAADQALAQIVEQSRHLQQALPRFSPPWVQVLACASDQFIVQRGPHGASQTSIIAGYPWFADWGRDTMIALPGLTIALGRLDAAASILQGYARLVNRGMLPNCFPDAGQVLEYNTVDATLWLFQTVADYLEARSDPDLLRELFPVLCGIIHTHIEGTRYGIQVDPRDGLLRAGEPGVQLTWMDARQGSHVVTPRIGKPVEINALWLNALDVCARLADRLNDSQQGFFETQLKTASAGFQRFWNAGRNCLYDVIDVDGGTAADASIRPNQIFAVSLPYCVLTHEQMGGIVDICARELLTSHGLRSLSAQSPAYCGTYTGDPRHRDGAYHQGTVWAWLLGPFVRAHYRVYGDASCAQGFLAPMAQHLAAGCIGSVSEIFDGDAPHRAKGCFAQAWSVAEILRSWIYLERKASKS